MTITMYDSVEVSRLPADAEAVAGYVGGDFPTYSELYKRFPKAHKLSIAVSASEIAHCLDIENGDATIAEAPDWFKRERAQGVWRPCLYTSIDNLPALLVAMYNAGIHRSEYRIWSAHYTGVPHIEENSDATQYEEDAVRDIDISLCLSSFFDVAPPKPKPVIVVDTWQPADEKRWCREWEALKGKNGPFAKVRRIALKGRMVAREVEIGRLAAQSGWGIKNRVWRYKKLKSLVG
jgi:hypothetical protein